MLGVVVLGMGALAWNKRRIVAEDEHREAMNRAAARVYAKVSDVIPPKGAALSSEPTVVVGKVLPVTSGGLEIVLDGWLYPRLPEALRARDDSEASTVVVVVTNTSTLYSDSQGIPSRGMISDVTLTLVDVAHRNVLGQKQFRQDPPGNHASEAQLDAYSDGFWAPIASYLAALPRH